MKSRLEASLLTFAVLGLGGLFHTAVTPCAEAAGGSSKLSVDQTDLAASDYQRGLKYRDKALKYADKAEECEDASDRKRLKSKERKEYEKAIRAYRAALGTNPSMHQALSSLGYALRRTGDFEGSLAAYDRALAIDESYSEAIEYRGEAYLGLHRIPEAKEAYMVLLRQDRDRANELMAAMREWVEERKVDPAGIDAQNLEMFAAWVVERSVIAEEITSLGVQAEGRWRSDGS